MKTKELTTAFQKLFVPGMSIATLAKKTGIAEKTLHAVRKGRKGITPNIANMINRFVSDNK